MVKKLLCRTRLGDFLATFEQDFIVKLEFPGDFAKPFNCLEYASGIYEKFSEELALYIEGKKKNIDFPFRLTGVSEKNILILTILKDTISYGNTITYKELGEKCNIENPRVIGMAMKANPLPLIFPCHRVMSKDKNKNFYSPGVFYKNFLHRLENIKNEKYIPKEA